MSADDAGPTEAAGPTHAETPEVPPTGNAQVDGVLTSLDELTDVPVAEHVVVFERAHEQLRSALDAPADD